MMSEGTCWITSKSDPRWDATGRGQVGMFMQVDQSPLQGVYEALIAKYGDPPEDLEFGYMKD